MMNKCGLAWGTVLKQTFQEDIHTGTYLKQTIFLKKMQKVWLSSSCEIWSQTRCVILLISSLLAMLVTIAVLLTRLFAQGTKVPVLKSVTRST